MRKHNRTLTFGLLLLILSALTIQLTEAQTTDPSISLQNANTAINQAFAKVLTVENTGQDVSGLIARLSIAGDLLAQAENSYKSGDLTEVTAKANSAALAAAQVSGDAAAMLRTNGTQETFLITIAFTIIGIIITIVVLALVWRRLKRNHYRDMLALRPEVTNSAA